MIGKYHPHGDQSVYDAMVRLAQDFSLRYPLVDGQGNFGNVDGDNAAAMRYTEARLTAAAGELMAGLDEGTVDFRPTYNGEEEEPEVFPGLFPNLLANGASGIAVGMATSIPPHNVAELIDAAVHLIDNPKAERRGADGASSRARISRPAACSSTAPRRSRSLMRPAAAPSGCARAGRCEKGPQGTWTAVVTEIPYPGAEGQADRADRRADHRQEAADPRRRARRIRRGDPDRASSRAAAPSIRELLMDSLFRLTDLEIADPAQPQRARRQPHAAGDEPQAGADRLARPSRSRCWSTAPTIGSRKIDDRLELLDGYLIAFLNLDRVIEIIRTEDEPKPVMIAEFGLTDRQAEAILNMRLRSLAQARGDADPQASATRWRRSARSSPS